jgi:hypothetical protein
MGSLMRTNYTMGSHQSAGQLLERHVK